MAFSRRALIWIWSAAGLVVAQAAASLLLHRGVGLIVLTDLTQLLLLASGTLALLPNVLATHGRPRLFWSLMVLGLFFWFSYQALWSYFEVFLRRDVPNPFGGDVILFLHLVPMTAALAVQPDIDKDGRISWLGSLDFGMLLIWWLYLYLFAVIPWQYVFTREPAYDQNLNALYLTEKIVFLAGLALLCMRSKKRWRVIYVNLFAASLTYALSSYLANWAIARKAYFSGSIYDVPLGASMAWMTAIGIVAFSFPPKAQPGSESKSYGVWVTRLGMIAVFSLPLFAAWSVFGGTAPVPVRKFRLVVTLGSMLVMGSLVFFKQQLLDRELLRSLRTTQNSLENLRRVQAQLVQSEKLASLGQLVGGAAHELNNPLTAMLGYTELLGTTSVSPDQKQLVQKIEQQVRRTRSLVSSLLSFAQRVPAGKSLLDVNALVQTAVKLCPPHLRAIGIQVHTELADNLPRVLGDSNQLLQVCLHITNNAFHAMAESSGAFRVSTRRETDQVVIEFSDDGPGIEEPGRVFDPFYTTRPVGQGAGLGLSVCYGIIQEHKGKIFCQNRPEGGAMFRIELPAAPDSTATFATAPQPESSRTGQAPKALQPS